MNSHSFMLWLLAMTVLPLGQAQASLLVYEGYDYAALANDDSMDGVATNATGLDGTYDVAANTGIAFRYQTAGLTFGDKYLPTSGGSVRLGRATNQYASLGIGLDAGTVTGNLYQSFLFTFETNSATGTNSGSFWRVADAQTSGTNSRFATLTENRASGSAPGIGYDSDTVTTSAGGSLAADTTYLFLSRFSNVGTALSVGTPGVADLWIFTQAGYESWLAAGADEAELSTFALLDASDTATTGTHTFNSADFLQLAATTTGTGGGTFIGYYDELRFGTTLADVVPEPTSASLLAAGGLLLLRRRRR